MGCQIAVCILGYVLVTRGTAPQQKEREPEATESALGATDSALAEEERRMQYLGANFTSPGYSEEVLHIYLARYARLVSSADKGAILE